jgi:hypothetical protein
MPQASPPARPASTRRPGAARQASPNGRLLPMSGQAVCVDAARLAAVSSVPPHHRTAKPASRKGVHQAWCNCVMRRERSVGEAFVQRTDEPALVGERVLTEQTLVKSHGRHHRRLRAATSLNRLAARATECVRSAFSSSASVASRFLLARLSRAIPARRYVTVESGGRRPWR